MGIIAQTDSMIQVQKYVHSVVQIVPLVLISQRVSPVDFLEVHKPICTQIIIATPFVRMATTEEQTLVMIKYVFHAIILVMDAHCRLQTALPVQAHISERLA